MNGFDLSTAEQVASTEDEGTVVELLGPDEKPYLYKDANGEEKPVTITVAGAHSRRHRKAEEALRNRKLKPRQMTGQIFHEDNIEKVVACTLAWSGIADKGQPLELTRANVAMVYKRAPWILDQVQEAMNDHARFFENS